MVSAINILMAIGMVVGVFTRKLSIILSILCFIISIFCFYQSFKKLGDATTPSKRHKAITHVTINGFSVAIVCIISLLNVAIYNFKLLIIFFVLSITLIFVSKTIKFIKKNNR